MSAPPRTPVRKGITPDRVVAEAAAVADESGWDRLTLAAVAERLGVALPSLYKHVGGLDDLRSRVSVLALDQLADALAAAAVGRSGLDALRATATAYRDFARTHPGTYPATLRAPEPGDASHEAAGARVLEVVSGVLREYDLQGDDLVDAIRALRSTLHGLVSLELAGGFGLPRDVARSLDRLVAALDLAFRGSTYHDDAGDPR
ncbi:MAG: TetR-like C-terminal domain-containing protein [Candidatus Nanopelagicales bacterium]